MADYEKTIKGLDICTQKPCYCTDCPYKPDCYLDSQEVMEDALFLLRKQHEIIEEMRKSQDKTVNTWKHLWDAPDGSFKGRCESCGFVHFFVERHDSQYRFCPQCGEQKVT